MEMSFGWLGSPTINLLAMKANDFSAQSAEWKVETIIQVLVWDEITVGRSLNDWVS
jgi:hypothetical protein